MADCLPRVSAAVVPVLAVFLATAGHPRAIAAPRNAVDAEFEQKAKPAASGGGYRLVIHTPHPEAFELAVDEIELRWPAAPATERAQERPTAEAARVTLRTLEADRAVYQIAGAGDLDSLAALASDLEQQNPGTVAYLVLYDAEAPRGDTSRVLLGKEVAVLLDTGANPRTTLGSVWGAARAVTGVPDAFVIDASDPASALRLADDVRDLAGVKTAYPLLLRRSALR